MRAHPLTTAIAGIGAATLPALCLPSVSSAASCPAAPFAHHAETTQPPNLGEEKLQALDYKCFGQYDKDVADVLAAATAFVEERAGEVANPALVLDVDETALSNWTEILANDFGYIPGGQCDLRPGESCGVKAWERSGRATPIAPTVALFKAAVERHVAVFFITGRTDTPAQRAAMEANLRAAGYVGWKAVIMRPPGVGVAARIFKTVARATLAAQGYTIIANVGDQRSDLDGGYAERTFRVPNPFYFVP